MVRSDRLMWEEGDHGGTHQRRSMRTILIIGCDPLQCHQVLQTLDTPQTQVLVANEGIEGLALARQHQPDVILLDLALPTINGYALTRVLKQHPTTRTIPISTLR